MAKGSAQASADEKVLDFMQLYLGYQASAQAQVPEGHMVAGWAIARTLDPAFREALEEFVPQFLDDPSATTWIPAYRKCLVGSPAPEKIALYADWAESFLLWARRHPKVWKDAWDSVKSQRKALQVHDITQEDDPASQVRKLAALASISGMIRIRKWLEGATGQIGQPLSAVESVSADAQTVKGLTSKLNSVQTALDASVPMSEDHTQLQEQKTELNRQVKAVVDSSADSAAVLAAAVSGQTTSAVAAKARLNDEQVRAMLAEGNVLITAGAGAGKCLVADTLVATTRDVRQIQHCQDVTAVRTVDDKTLDFRDGDGEWLDMGMSPVVSVTTRSGIKITGTPEHPLLVWDGSLKWVDLQSLTPGMEVLVRPGYALGLGEQQVDPEEAYLLGLFMGDGCVTGDKVSWSRGGEHLPQHYHRLTQHFWNKTSKTCTHTQNPNSVSHSLYGKALIARLASQGLSFHSARDKELPLWLFRATNLEQVRFLQGLMDTDGSVWGNRTIDWASASENLARQVQQLFLGLGVHGRLRPKFNKHYCRNYWYLEFTGDSARDFAQHVGFRYEESKVARLETLVSQDSSPNVGVYSHLERYLTAFKEQWKNQGQWDGKKQAIYRDDRWKEIKGYLKGNRSPSRRQLRSFLEGVDGADAHLLSNLTNYQLDTVVSVVPQEVPAHVFDFHVPETHSFIANGIVSHNTAVMAAKVAYHVLEQGMSPDQVLAVSFTRKAATELKERVEKLYGIQSDTISTTHTLAGNVLREFHPGARAVLAKTSPRNSDKLMRLAFAQIALSERSGSSYGYGGRGGWRGRRAAYGGSSGGNPYWKEPAGQWFNLGMTPADEDGKPIGRNALSAIVEVAQSHSETWQDIKAKADQNPRNSLLRFGAAFYAAYEWLKENDPELSPYRDFNDWLGDAADLMEKNPQALASMQRRFKVVLVDEAQDLNKQQQRLFNAIAAKAKVYAQIGDDRQCVSVDTLVDTPQGNVRVDALKVGDQILAYRNGHPVYQTVKHVVPSSWERGYLVTTQSGRELLMSPNHKIWATGFQADSNSIHLSAHSLEGSCVAYRAAGKSFGFQSYRDALTLAQGMQTDTGKTVQETLAWGSDALVLVTSSDLQVGQEVPVHVDGVVSLETIVSIVEASGKFIDLDVDDASCFFGNGILSHNSIYKFRGAVPELFTELPKKGFDTYNLTFNYRSGKNIVDSAEKLISHNGDRQIPKTCRANPSRVEDGLVEMVRPETHEVGAVQVSEEIANSCTPEAGGSPANFGILVRNNAEADAYAIALMSKGIPFRSRTSYFDKSAVKALLAWCQLAVSQDPNVINAATLKAHMRPGFFLGDKFMEGLQQYCPRGKTYADYIIEGGTAYMSGYNAKNIALYGEEIAKLRRFQGTASDLINAVLGVTGSKGISFRDALAEDVDPEELMEGTDKLEVSKEEIAEAAVAPVNPLIKMAQKFEDPEKWLAFVDRMVKANDKTLKKEDDQTPAVRIDTVHSWKGLQAKHVYVIMAGGGVFPNNHALNESNTGVNTALDEERRLAYVAITRGEDAVTVVCPATNYRGKPADVPGFVAEACIQPRAGFQASLGKTANWASVLESALDQTPDDLETSLESAWGDLL